MNWKKGIAVALSAITVMAMVAGCGSNTTTSDQKKIGVIQLVEHPSLDAANKGFVDGLASKGFKDGENIKIDQQNAQADQSNLNSFCISIGISSTLASPVSTLAAIKPVW